MLKKGAVTNFRLDGEVTSVFSMHRMCLSGPPTLYFSDMQHLMTDTQFPAQADSFPSHFLGKTREILFKYTI